MAVDHPAGTEVWSTSASPSDAELRRSSPARCSAGGGRDDRGRTSASCRAQDDRHADFAGRGACQGVTRRHAIELTLPGGGAAHRAAVARGARLGASDRQLGQRGDGAGASRAAAGPRARGRGRRRAVPLRPAGLGFPSGKDKTVLLDLAGVFPATAAGPRRLRLSTNLEIFWDRIGWAVGPSDVRVEPRACRR
jgi:hypothetical protein